MASIGIVNADVPDQVLLNEHTIRDKRIYFGVFFDGTGNNMVQKEDAIAFRRQQRNDQDWEFKVNYNLNQYGAHELGQRRNKDNDYSNVAILHGRYQAMSGEEFKQAQNDYEVYRFNIYVEGAGTGAINRDSTMQDIANVSGSGFGAGVTGVVSLVSKAVTMIRMMLKCFGSLTERDEIHFDVFGFSRGSACARLFAFLVARSPGERLACEDAFAKYSARSYYSQNFLHFMDDIVAKSQVDFLGIYDTVTSIGISYKNNVSDYGQHSPTMGKVKNTFHICAMDEFRQHFGLTDIGNASDAGGNAEFFIPGCHSDVGGGYLAQKEQIKLSLDTLNLVEGKTRVYVENPQSSSGITAILDKTSLQNLGWISAISTSGKTSTNYLTDKITVTRTLKAGYNTIPLLMMLTRACTKTHRHMYGPLPMRFEIPGDLRSYGEQLISRAQTVNGRHWYYPQGSFKSQFYRYIRSTYLHFTSTDAMFSDWVHGPSKIGNTICRIVYRGDGTNARELHMVDYNAVAESI